MNVILRSVFNRPEMLYLSLKYEKIAREYFDGEYVTLFVIDAGFDPKCLEVINDYSFNKVVVKRPSNYKVCANIMEGLKQACSKNIEYVINMEDDLILHKSYFKFVKNAHLLLKDIGYSVITTWGYSSNGDPSIIKKTNFSCGPGTMINKKFFEEFIMPFANLGYYNDWLSTINKINELNKDNSIAKYSKKIGNQYNHMDWDGLMNRLVDYVSFTHNLHSYSSLCFRLLHIGFYGYNRHGKRFPKELNTFNKRVDFLEENIFNPSMLINLDGYYSDYSVFDDRLDSWNGTLKLEV